jgi:hypothetical protein
MTAHDNMVRAGYPPERVRSYGSWEAVRVPSYYGDAMAFPFGTPYREMGAKLAAPGPQAVTWLQQTGLAAMIERDISVKAFPERWQSLPTSAAGAAALAGGADAGAHIFAHDVVICFDAHVFRLVSDDMKARGLLCVSSTASAPPSPIAGGSLAAAAASAAARQRLQLVLIHTRDTIEDAKAAGRNTVDFADALLAAVGEAAALEAEETKRACAGADAGAGARPFFDSLASPAGKLARGAPSGGEMDTDLSGADADADEDAVITPEKRAGGLLGLSAFSDEMLTPSSSQATPSGARDAGGSPGAATLVDESARTSRDSSFVSSPLSAVGADARARAPRMPVRNIATLTRETLAALEARLQLPPGAAQHEEWIQLS